MPRTCANKRPKPIRTTNSCRSESNRQESKFGFTGFSSAPLNSNEKERWTNIGDVVKCWAPVLHVPPAPLEEVLVAIPSTSIIQILASIWHNRGGNEIVHPCFPVRFAFPVFVHLRLGTGARIKILEVHKKAGRRKGKQTWLRLELLEL